MAEVEAVSEVEEVLVAVEEEDSTTEEVASTEEAAAVGTDNLRYAYVLYVTKK